MIVIRNLRALKKAKNAKGLEPDTYFVPKGELVLELKDSLGNLIEEKRHSLTMYSSIAWEKLVSNLDISQDGNLSVYIDNASSDKVYFDEFIIERTEAAVAVVVQENHYYPFGMNMKGIEELDLQSLSSTDEHRFQYNGKEKEEAFGLYWNDHGARNLDVQLGKWNGIDPLAEKYQPISPYTYVANNPLAFVDTDGKRILLVNGYWNRVLFGGFGIPTEGGKGYWTGEFGKAAQKFFNDYSTVENDYYIDGSSLFGGSSSGEAREEDGYEYAKENYSTLTKGLGDDETFKLVTHSEGGAYGAGIARYLIEKGHKVETILHLSTDEGDEFKTPEEPFTIQFSLSGDWVTGNKEIKKGVDLFAVFDRYFGKENKSAKERKGSHGSTASSGIFAYVQLLLDMVANGSTGVNVKDTATGVVFEIIRDNNKKDETK